MTTLGFKGRFFPDQWRSASEEIAFAKLQQFNNIEIVARFPNMLTSESLGGNLRDIGREARDSEISLSVEIFLKLNEDGLTNEGKDAADVLNIYLDVMADLGCAVVHFHPVPSAAFNKEQLSRIEDLLVPQFARAVEVGRANGIAVAFEHNEPAVGLVASSEACRRLLKAVPGLKFVWDINHTPLEEISAFRTLIEDMLVVHASDTPLPKLNHHLPLGQGNVDFESHLVSLKNHGFQGAIVLEIGGLPVSGGVGKDTDEALSNSLRRLRQAIKV